MNLFFWRKKTEKSPKLINKQLQLRNDDGTWTDTEEMTARGRTYRYVLHYSNGRVAFDYEVEHGSL